MGRIPAAGIMVLRHLKHLNLVDIRKQVRRNLSRPPEEYAFQ